MRTRLTSIGKGIAGLGAAGLALLGSTTPAQAATVPFTDSNAGSSIGLCDAHGNPITSGSIDSHAFVSAAAASAASPAGYGFDQHAKATLYAFQPREGVDPGEWSGYQLTGSSAFADDAHPMAAGTNLDPSLRDFVSSFPAKWDGLVQLRLYYTAPNKVAYTDPYPAAVLQISGNRWTMLQGASMHCDLAKVVSNEKILLPASDFDPNHPAVTHAPAPPGAVTAAPGTVGSAAASSVPVPVPVSSTALAGRPSPVANVSTQSNKSSTSPAWWGLVIVAVLGAGGAVAWRRLRTR